MEERRRIKKKKTNGKMGNIHLTPSPSALRKLSHEKAEMGRMNFEKHVQRYSVDKKLTVGLKTQIS